MSNYPNISGYMSPPISSFTLPPFSKASPPNQISMKVCDTYMYIRKKWDFKAFKIVARQALKDAIYCQLKTHFLLQSRNLLNVVGFQSIEVAKKVFVTFDNVFHAYLMSRLEKNEKKKIHGGLFFKSTLSVLRCTWTGRII